MEYAPQGSLRSCHTKGTRVPLITVVEYVKQVAAALQYIHDYSQDQDKNFVHRDVKPHNMLVGKNNEILLSDFGIITVSSSINPSQRQDQSGTFVYSAPEQLQKHPVRASDQYALGITVYEWLCGDPPFESDGMSPPDIQQVQLMNQHLNVAPQPLHEKVPTILPEVEQVVLKALAKDPQQRYASVRDFAMALEQAIEEPATKHSQPSPDLPPTRRVLNPTPEDLNMAGKHEEAIKASEEVLRLNPRDDSAYINLAWALNELGRHEKAIQASNQAIALKETAPAYTNLGWALHELSRRPEDYEEALQAHEKALVINPNFAPASNGKGNALLALKRYQEALDAYERAISIHPRFVAAYRGKGKALWELGRFQEAQQAYEQEQRLKR